MMKRSTMEMYGHLEFDVFANPVVYGDNSTVRYDGYASFQEGDVMHTIMMVDGIAYIVTSAANGTETAECSSSPSLALLDYFIPALNKATVISDANADDTKLTCSSGDMLEVMLEDASFVLCRVGSKGIFVYGCDLNIRVKYLKNPVPIKAPILSKDAARLCQTIISPSPVKATALALLTGRS
ncbi:uncharacterized protein PHALS_02498 [Plasmopara halstedii]|uniref:Uncharacterized protein n=1 Tax=Plasmopara halstedii TaxID=4781 RepID=A0A0P1A6Z0_PLAHL|nr:uncharacterized protein PHALS_02498 [Plasmopara halstedii]CEG36398.1 hypothetical protein PHALS_02498 [Plasmopara halstedii]|eukprot:XP_024572767.1 hypothetical protein PHALS_02498 [Plasmopara halstedii]